MPRHGSQTVTCTELHGALGSVDGKVLEIRLHKVTDSEPIYAGFMEKRHGWVGSRGPLAHTDLWDEVRWKLAFLCSGYRHTSHVGVGGPCR